MAKGVGASWSAFLAEKLKFLSGLSDISCTLFLWDVTFCLLIGHSVCWRHKTPKRVLTCSTCFYPDMSKNTNSLCLSYPLCSIISSVSCHFCSLCAYVFIFSKVMLLELSCYTWYLIIPPDLRGSSDPLFSRSIFHPLCSFCFASHLSLFLSFFKKKKKAPLYVIFHAASAWIKWPLFWKVSLWSTVPHGPEGVCWELLCRIKTQSNI